MVFMVELAEWGACESGDLVCFAGKVFVERAVWLFYDQQASEVLICSIKLKEFQLRWIRGKIGRVSQEQQVLFASSIKDNTASGEVEEQPQMLPSIEPIAIEMPMRFDPAPGHLAVLFSIAIYSGFSVALIIGSKSNPSRILGTKYWKKGCWRNFETGSTQSIEAGIFIGIETAYYNPVQDVQVEVYWSLIVMLGICSNRLFFVTAAESFSPPALHYTRTEPHLEQQALKLPRINRCLLILLPSVLILMDQCGQCSWSLVGILIASVILVLKLAGCADITCCCCIA